LKELKLNQFNVHLDEYIEKIHENQISLVEALYELTEKEIEIKNFNAQNAMVKVAGFPHRKELKDFEFDFQPKLNKQQFLDFATLRFLEKRENIILIGNSGVGNYRKFLLMERNKFINLYITICRFISCHNNFLGA